MVVGRCTLLFYIFQQNAHHVAGDGIPHIAGHAPRGAHLVDAHQLAFSSSRGPPELPLLMGEECCKKLSWYPE